MDKRSMLCILATMVACKSVSPKSTSDAASIDKRPIAEDVFNYLSMSPELIRKKYTDPAQLFQALGKNQALRTGRACAKLDTLWDAIWTTREPEGQLAPAARDNAIAFGNATAESYWKSFIGFTDGSEVRPEGAPRLTHRYGTFAQLKLEIDEPFRNKYTGHFRGSECILARFSSAVSPGSSKDRFTPAFSAKFFMDGNFESMGLFAQHDFGGQGADMNFFAKPLSNRLQFEKGVFSGVGSFSRFFWTAQKFLKSKGISMPDPRELSAEHLGTMTQAGQRVEAPVAPRFIFLLPAEIPSFPSEWHDYREDFIQLNQKMSLDTSSSQGKVVRGVKILNLYVSDRFTTEPLREATKIGSFETRTVFVASDAADRRVFFKHTIVPRETADYATDFPKAQWNDAWFTESCDRMGATQQDVEDNPLIPGSSQGFFIDSYLFKRKCSRDLLESKLGGL